MFADSGEYSTRITETIYEYIEHQLLVFIFIIPLPLFFAQTVYSEKGYAAWVGIGIAWVFCSSFAVVIYPVFESRQALTQIIRGIYTVSHILVVACNSDMKFVQDLFTKRSGKFVPEKPQQVA